MAFIGLTNLADTLFINRVAVGKAGTAIVIVVLALVASFFKTRAIAHDLNSNEGKKGSHNTAIVIRQNM